ncbi:protein bunched, class 1/class 3/D/E isoforms-like isoform X3 [Drosophila serrata]|uniref:protein bunched, class 1/class 3/D/E isoforms-like isoform X3 n=1 Tax=Drosophila serrata TaxID=7274 RepID=UPI000A1D2515|nr:protein bunched, class 1/class 3/D/E isoforms-like isoform X3 [Drosophila serrata]
MLKYPRTTSSTSSGYFDDDEAMMNPYQTPPASPQSVPQYLQRHMVRMFSTEVDNASGTSAVAIDNKIEQAMDLVKSHLMIAVREEVEVLKERISELMDKINKLEVENTILKSHIPQETLQQIQMQLQIAGSQQPAAVAAPPATPAIQAPPPTSAPNAAGQAAAVAAAAAAAAGAIATSPASVAAPTSIPNGSAENGTAVPAVSSGSGNNSDASVVEQVTVAAAVAAVPTVNGPMS